MSCMSKQKLRVRLITFLCLLHHSIATVFVLNISKAGPGKSFLMSERSVAQKRLGTPDIEDFRAGELEHVIVLKIICMCWAKHASFSWFRREFPWKSEDFLSQILVSPHRHMPTARVKSPFLAVGYHKISSLFSRSLIPNEPPTICCRFQDWNQQNVLSGKPWSTCCMPVWHPDYICEVGARWKC